jgi:hypothetical protein
LVPLVAGGIVLGLLLTIGTVVLVVALNSGGNVSAGQGGGGGIFRNPLPTADKEGLSWSPKELASHLRANGVIGEYEVEEAQQTAFGKTHGGITARTPGGGKVHLKKHAGAISAEDHVKRYDTLVANPSHFSKVPAFLWGAWTVTSDDYHRDDATVVAGGLPGAKKYFNGQPAN